MVKMLIQYQINATFHVQYKEIMKDIIKTMHVYGATLSHWNEHEKNQYLEVYTIPTEAYYFAIKKMRQSSKNIIFESLNQCLSDSTQSIQWMAIRSSY